jgi:polysaccharide biosynthesis/export protein
MGEQVLGRWPAFFGFAAKARPALALSLLLAAAGSLAGCGPSVGNGFEELGAVEGKPATAFSAGLGTEPAKASAPVVKAADALTATTTPGNTAYKVGPHDVLEVSVFKVPELSKSVQVADTGTINLPLVGEVRVVGKTAQDIERDLTKKLGGKFLQKPQVTVYVREYNSQRVTMEGAVKKPGVYPIRGKTTLLQFIAIAEGLDPNSDSMVVVFRQMEGKRAAAKFDIGEIRSGKMQDPVIQSGDVIVASTSVFKETFNTILKALPIAGMFALL